MLLLAHILTQFAHPAFSKSRAHRALINAAGSIHGVTVNDLYPNQNVDTKHEQALAAKSSTARPQDPSPQ